MGIPDGTVSLSHTFICPYSSNLTQSSPLDSLVTFAKAPGISSTTAPVRYAVRQVLDQEYRKESIRKNSEALSSIKTTSKKSSSDSSTDAAKLKSGNAVKRDFFGRIIEEPQKQEDPSAQEGKPNPAQQEALNSGRKVWVTYHDGFSNAVRKPISLTELLGGL